MLGKAPARSMASLGFPCGNWVSTGMFGSRGTQGVGGRGCAVPLLPPTPQQGQGRCCPCAQLFSQLTSVRGNPVLFPLGNAVLEWDSMILPDQWQPWAELCLEAVLWHLCQGVGQSPNCSALAKCPWVTIAGDSSAGGVGGTVQCRVGHQVLCHLCLNQLCLALAAPSPTPLLSDPSLWFSKRLGSSPAPELCPLWVWHSFSS